MVKYYETGDVLFLVLLFLFVFISAGMMAQGTMQTEAFLAFISIAAIYALIKPISVLIWQKEVEEKHKGKNAYEYWNMIKEQIKEAAEKYGFDTIKFPDDYLPNNMLTIETLNLFLAEIQKEELVRKTGDQRYSQYKFDCNTIVFNIGSGVVRAQLRGKGIPEAVKFINSNIHFFAEPKKEVAVPERIREIIFGKSKSE